MPPIRAVESAEVESLAWRMGTNVFFVYRKKKKDWLEERTRSPPIRARGGICSVAYFSCQDRPG